ncbi:MAG TPA: hypothetical protein VLI92_04625 [Candidatus Saccharimonadales bacterium]|nr:hypothetical protein [Candidatus Saccharimonadales bacterium]
MVAVNPAEKSGMSEEAIEADFKAFVKPEVTADTEKQDALRAALVYKKHHERDDIGPLSKKHLEPSDLEFFNQDMRGNKYSGHDYREALRKVPTTLDVLNGDAAALQQRLDALPNGANYRQLISLAAYGTREHADTYDPGELLPWMLKEYEVPGQLETVMLERLKEIGTSGAMGLAEMRRTMTTFRELEIELYGDRLTYRDQLQTLVSSYKR